MNQSEKNLTPISATIITMNEERKIAEVLQSLSFCQEILVLDSGSTDKTLEICKKYNVRVEHLPFLGFGPQKRRATELAKYDWILNVDADEVVSPELRNEILGLQLNNPQLAYSVYQATVFMGKTIKGNGGHHGRQTRLYNKKYSDFTEDQVHEYVKAKQVIPLDGQLLHYSYKDLHHYFEKFNRYTSLYAQAKTSHSTKKISFILIPLGIPLILFKYLLLEGMLFKGVPGISWAMLSTMYWIVKKLKVYELNYK